MDYRLVLSSENKDHLANGAANTCMILYPSINRTQHFCGIGCLAAWLADEYPTANEEYQRLQTRRRHNHEQAIEYAKKQSQGKQNE